MKETKFIFVTGGVLSSLGKGLAAASIGALLKSRGLNVSIQKLDPYLNVDPGTMNPFQHGEVFVTDDGAETDLDLGHYERYLGVPMQAKNSYTAGKIYNEVIEKERRGIYRGGTVQVIPHITDEIKAAIMTMARDDLDVALIEIGGTVGDIEGLPFLEAIRQMKKDLGPERCLYVHLTWAPYLKTSGELKSKPTQRSVKELRAIGIQPDIILCRSEVGLGPEFKAKIALFCDVDEDSVFSVIDAASIYEVPLNLHQEGVDRQVALKLGLKDVAPDIGPWERLAANMARVQGEITIGIIGKYVELKEAYKSLHESLVHGAMANKLKIGLNYINSEELTAANVAEKLRGLDGILIPGGFGSRGIEGMIQAARYARENKIPFFGICLGMQCLVIEYARNVAGLSQADSEEFAPQAEHKVIYHMKSWFDPRRGEREERRQGQELGGTMRLGSYPCDLTVGTRAYEAYKTGQINERHRHRFEFNPQYRRLLEDHGLIISGASPDGELTEIVELAEHPWYLGCQFHPEFKSTPMTPQPLFTKFIQAAWENRRHHES